MRAQAGAVPVGWALGALYIGIVLGDVGLYGLGKLAGRVRWARRLVPPNRMRQGRDWLKGRVFWTVFISRFIPGARLPTYTACGFLGGSLLWFGLAAIVATSIWTSLLFGVSYKMGDLLMPYLGEWRWAGLAGFAVILVLFGRTAAKWQTAR
ncbi:MAG: VTT domain-containing protein [Acidisphaera sp.]|nr:VTT domain-containing protein [Acidisphaera sp.]MBV9812733.1 VTT domain-containing protein [Acetobacteraceae bacterium]